MAYKLIWSPASRDDLRDIVSFISRDSRQRAEAFAYRLIAETDKLQSFPEIGRVVPEYDIPTLREIIVRAYRIVYRLDHEVCLRASVRLKGLLTSGPRFSGCPHEADKLERCETQMSTKPMFPTRADPKYRDIPSVAIEGENSPCVIGSRVPVKISVLSLANIPECCTQLPQLLGNEIDGSTFEEAVVRPAFACVQPAAIMSSTIATTAT